MQAEVTDSSLREGIEAMGMRDTARSTGSEEEGIKEQKDTEMTAASQEETTSREEKGGSDNI